MDKLALRKLIKKYGVNFYLYLRVRFLDSKFFQIELPLSIINLNFLKKSDFFKKSDFSWFKKLAIFDENTSTNHKYYLLSEIVFVLQLEISD